MSATTFPPPTIQRNELGGAYRAAEELFSNASALAIFLDAWSKRGRTPRFTPDALDHVRHNLINARSNLAALEAALAHHIGDHIDDHIDDQEQTGP